MSVQDQHRQAPGAVLFAAVFLILSVFLVSQLGAETKFAPMAKMVGKYYDAAVASVTGEEVRRVRGKFFAQPAFWPAVGVIGMSFFGLFHLIGVWRRRVGGDLAEAAQWLRSLEYLVWFMIYVWSTPVVGYLASTLIFTAVLAARVGYRAPRTILAAAGTGLAIVLVFKTLLAVKIPGGAVYEFLPDGIRSFMIIHF